ncbi:precorrin-8X methylmutase [Prochlorococcus sp. MIT 1223]|uniref:precorrin-8X methylmutase n=1 Tax=Prochlorococcus sp. MIT 1223 TaxID=3096217 RepID=UPI002A7664C3|nr:precorrin-8X methylmutase [Prochlorococcus sp. MIT 1223]
MQSDHPIFKKSLKIIQSQLGFTGLNDLEQQVLERLIHTTGDFAIQHLLKFSPDACQIGISALKSGAPILTDTAMAMAAITPMASRTLCSQVNSVLDWAPSSVEGNQTRIGIGMKNAWIELSRKFTNSQSPIVIIGSAPTGLDSLLDLIDLGLNAPSLIIGMPVGFVGVTQSKNRLLTYDCPQILLEGNRGGAAIAGATVNALLRAAILSH